ncbi:MAG: hypothetical protein ABI888_02940 [Chloroflexota bacterium]
MTVAVYLESGAKRVFACAVDWPGWARSGQDADAALAALLASAPRYAPIAAAAGFSFPERSPLEVVERLQGNATTDFGAPGVIRKADAESLTGAHAQRLVALVEASWAALDRAAAKAPEILRKGPRGGGRDRSEIVAHVVDAERLYARGLGLRAPAVDPLDRAAVATLRRRLSAALLTEPDEPARWPRRFAARRIAWHVLDHAWEIADRGSG